MASKMTSKSRRSERIIKLVQGLGVPASLKHIDNFVQKQKTAMKGKMKRRSIPESSVYTPQKNLVSSTFHNKINRNIVSNPVTSKNQNSINSRPTPTPVAIKQQIEVNSRPTPSPVASKKENEMNSRVTASDSKGNFTSCASASPVNNKESARNNHSENQRNSPQVGESPLSSLPRFLRKRLPYLESLKDLQIDDEDDGASEKDNSDSGRHTSSRNSSSKQLQIEVLKREIFEIVDEHPDGVLCADLITIYRQRHGKPLDYGRLGHMSLLSAAVSIGLHAAPAACNYRLGRTSPPAPPAARPAPRPAPRPGLRVRRAPTPPDDDDDALPGVPYDKDIFPADCLHIFLGDAYNVAMEAVMDDMAEYYRRGAGGGGEGAGGDRLLLPGAVRVGHYVACLYEGDWHRAIIVRTLDRDTVKVRHIDYGTVQTVQARELRPLLRRFGDLPALAVRARLAGVRPAQHALRWQLDTPCVQRVQDDILEVYLINTSGAEDVCVNEELIRQGYAEPAPTSAADDPPDVSDDDVDSDSDASASASQVAGPARRLPTWEPPEPASPPALASSLLRRKLALAAKMTA